MPVEYNGGTLIPVTELSPSKQKAISSLGGQKRSKKKSLARQIQHMRKNGVKNKTIQKWIDLTDHPDVSIMDIRKYLQQAVDICIATDDVRGLLACTKLMMELHKIVHGGKDKDMTIEAKTQPAIINIIKPDDNKLPADE